MGPRWGIDIQAEYVEGLVLESLGAPRSLRRLRVASEVDKGYYHVLGQVHKLVEVLSAEVGMRASKIGVAVPGNFDPITKTLKQSGLNAFEAKPLATDLRTYLGLEVTLQDAARCMTLAETRFGIVTESVPNAKCVVGVRLGNYLSGAVVINGRILNGRQGIAGSFAHSYLDAKGGNCWCGKHGCAETLLAGRSIERFYTDLSGKHLPLSTLFGPRNESLPYMAELREHVVYNLAKALGPVINLLDPDCIVLGGLPVNDDVVFNQLPEVLKRFVHNSRLDTVLVRPKLGRRVVVTGAALL